MQTFRYYYNDETYESEVMMFLDGSFTYYQLKMSDGLECTITSSGIRCPENKTIWVQSHKPDEKVLSHDLIQALGEGLENAGITILDS
jgi:hypothetical protein